MQFNQHSESAHDFCAELYRGCNDGYMNIAIFDKSGTKRFFSITTAQAKTPALTAAIASSLNANVFFQVTPIFTAIGGHARGKVGDVHSVPAFFADIDFKNPGKNEQRLPTNDTEALKMFLPGGFMPPTLIVETGRGLHAYWILEEPIAVTDETIRSDMVTVAAAFGSAFRSFAMNKFGWKFDSTSDLARLGRLPGTFNVKGAVPLPVQWRSDAQSQRYSIDHIADEIERFGTKLKQRSAQESNGRKSTQASGTSNASLAQLLRLSDAQWRVAIQLEEPVGPNPASIIAGCGFLQHANTNAATLAEPEWFETLRLLRGVHNGEEVAQAISRPHPTYDEAKTKEKFKHARDYEGEVTCEGIASRHNFEGCATCPFRDRLDSPVDLGDRSRFHVELLASTAYIERSDEFIDLKRVSKPGVKAEQFTRFNGGKGLFDAASKAITSDSLAIKAHERAYRPNRGPGTFIEDGTIFLNYYRAPSHAPSSARPRLFYQHLRYLVPDRAERKVVIRWLARLVQRPAEKLGYAVALVGGQGTGKSWLLSLMLMVLGVDNVRISGGGSVTSDFNGHLAGRVLLGLEEVTITGRAEAYEGLKTLITNETAEFQRKRIDRETLETPRGVLVLSNDTYALHLPADDRRFFVVQTPATKHPGGTAYYNTLFTLDDAFVASVYASLMRVDLSGFNWKTPPFETDAKKRMVGYSRADIDVLVKEHVDEQRGPFAYALATWANVRAYVREESADKSLTDKRIKRALEQAGVILDPQGRQCRLKGGGRETLYLIRCVDQVASETPKQLGDLYDQDHARLDKLPGDDGTTKPPPRAPARNAYLAKAP